MADERDTGPNKAPDSGASLEKKVVDWLNNQGYPLEMFTERCCREKGLATHQSWYYRDRESGQQRETDVFAHTRRLSVTSDGREFQLSFTFECKQSRSKPWVALVHTDGTYRLGLKAAMVQRIVPEYCEEWWINLAHKAGRHNNYPLDNGNPVGYSLVRVSFDKSDNDLAYAALMSAAKAAIGITDWLDTASKAEKAGSLYFTVVIPVLVLDSPLFSCCLDDNNEIRVLPIQRCSIQWANQVGAMPNTIVEVVTKESLPDFLQEMNDAFAQIVSLARSGEPLSQ